MIMIYFQRVKNTFMLLCMMYNASNCLTDHMLKATIVSLFSESIDVVKISGSVCFPGDACSLWTINVWCMLFLIDTDFVIFKLCNYENRWIVR